MELTSPHKHIENTSTILTENNLNTGRKTHTAKAVRKIHTDPGWKGRQAIRLLPAPLEGDTEEEQNYMGSEVIPGD